ncbi:hypothetical protein AMTRI_Chr06g176900 [Amborella trichopoda]
MTDLANASGGAWKTMFALKITVQKELLDHIRESTTPKEAWDASATLFVKTNDARLQFLENELRLVQSLCDEISKLDPESRINEKAGETVETNRMREGFQPGGARRGNTDIECYNCGKNGHFAQNCWSMKKKSAEGNTVTTTSHQFKIEYD